MITNKDLSIDSENGKITLNGNKYDLGTQGEIDAAVKDVYSVMGQNGAKNLIPYPYYDTTKEVNGVVATDNGDGTLTINGTASANTTVFKYLNNDAAIEIPLERRKYKLTFGTDQGSSGFHLGDYRVVKTDSTTQTINVTGDTIIDNTNGDYIGINAMSVYVAKDKTLNNVTIYPMLRLAADTDNTYQPYAMTNKQLTTALGSKQDNLTFDTVPTENSTNPVESGGVYDAIESYDNATVQQLNIFKNNKTVSIYGLLQNLSSSDTLIEYTTLEEKYRPSAGYVIAPLISTTAPYLPVGSVWIQGTTGKVSVYKEAARTDGYVSLTYLI